MKSLLVALVFIFSSSLFATPTMVESTFKWSVELDVPRSQLLTIRTSETTSMKLQCGEAYCQSSFFKSLESDVTPYLAYVGVNLSVLNDDLHTCSNDGSGLLYYMVVSVGINEGREATEDAVSTVQGYYLCKNGYVPGISLSGKNQKGEKLYMHISITDLKVDAN